MKVSRALPSRPASVSEARGEVDGLVGHLTPAMLEDARLLVSELVTNAVTHGATSASGEIHLAIDVDDERLRVEVTDQGPGFQRAEPAPGIFGSGWGLYFVSRLSDRWGVTSDGSSVVWFELDRRDGR